MSQKEKIFLEIGGIDRQIEEYRRGIMDLEETYKVIKLNYNEIEEKANKPMKEYDLNVLSAYGRAVHELAEKKRGEIVRATEAAQRDTLKLLSEIQGAMKKMQEEIKKCENKKQKLEEELAGLS